LGIVRPPSCQGSCSERTPIRLERRRGGAGLARAGDTLFYGTGWNGKIGRAKLDGSGADHDGIQLAAPPSALAVDDRHVYWTQGTDLGRAAIDGGVNPAFKALGFSSAAMTLSGGRLYAGVSPLTRMALDGSGYEPSFASGFAAFGIVVVEQPAAAPVVETVSAGTGAVTPVALRNSGGGDLRVSVATVAGRDAGDFSAPRSGQTRTRTSKTCTPGR
jgi:hypothetical protein